MHMCMYHLIERVPETLPWLVTYIHTRLMTGSEALSEQVGIISHIVMKRQIFRIHE